MFRHTSPSDKVQKPGIIEISFTIAVYDTVTQGNTNFPEL